MHLLGCVEENRTRRAQKALWKGLESVASDADMTSFTLATAEFLRRTVTGSDFLLVKVTLLEIWMVN